MIREMRVLNKYHDKIPKSAVNIMRPGPFGNPFHIGEHGCRVQVVVLYRHYIRKRIEIDFTFRKQVADLYGHDLVCCCEPKLCHGRPLRRLCLMLNGVKP